MRIEYSELMERLGIGHNLSAYETRPWFLHDSEKGIMCSAEVRVGPGISDVEAEIQFLHDDDKEPEPEPEKQPEKKSLPFIKYGPSGQDEIIDNESKDDTQDEQEKKPKRGPILGPDGPEQIMIMRYVPNQDALWQGLFLIIRGETYHDKIANWDERGAAFFCDFISALQMNELPDVDELIEEHLVDKKRGGRGRRGRVGKKGFKVEQKGMTMGMKG
jgi:hypothetical protein